MEQQAARRDGRAGMERPPVVLESVIRKALKLGFRRDDHRLTAAAGEINVLPRRHRRGVNLPGRRRQAFLENDIPGLRVQAIEDPQVLMRKIKMTAVEDRRWNIRTFAGSPHDMARGHIPAPPGTDRQWAIGRTTKLAMRLRP